MLIIGTRLFGTSTPITSSFIAGVLASAVIVLLAAYQWSKKEQITKADPTGTDRVGDELYYLGLIFTLVSLMYGLFYISISGQYETREAITHLVGSFAIALISTLVGIVLRIMFQSVSRADGHSDVQYPVIGTVPKKYADTETLDQKHLHPSTSLLDATIRFERELQASIQIIKLFRDQFDQDEKTFRLYVKNISNELDENLKEFPRISKEVLHVTSTELSDVSKKVLENFGKESTKMCEDVIVSLQRSCEATLSNMEERSKETMEQIAFKSNDHLNNLIEIYARNEVLVQGTVGKIERDTSSYLETVELSISETASVINAAMSEIRQHTSNLSSLTHVVNENLRMGVDSLQVLDSTVKNIEGTLSNVQEPAKNTELATKTIVADVSIAKSGLDSVVQHLEQLKPTIAAVKADSDAIVQDLETVKVQTQELRSHVEKSKKSKLARFFSRFRPGVR